MLKRRETVKEFLFRGGKIKVLPDEIPWKILPMNEDRSILKSAVETLDYERDHRPKWKRA